jgi:hypothetical protein
VQRFDALAKRVRSLGQPWELAVFLWIPGVALACACWYELRSRGAFADFDIFRAAALSVIHGRSPYVPATAAALAHFDKFVYPPVAALPFAPLAVLPLEVERMVMFLAALAALLGALRLLGVKDWRCYSVAVVSAPALNSLALGALTSFLLLGAALAWRYRDRPAVTAAATACAALVKLFLWPLAIWLVATRRWRAAGICAVFGAVLLIGGWAVIDFAGMRSYPTLVHVLGQLEAPVSYSVVAFLGLGGRGATVVTVVLSLGAVAAVVLAARGPDGDRRAFTVAVLVSLVATPLLWLHYLVLLFVPIALYRPRFSGLWLLPLALWATPATHSDGSAWRIALALGAVAVVGARTVFEGDRFSRAGAVPRPAAS